jgi:uroporphyrinogen decarboxylase
MASLKGYRWPDPDDERICGRIHEMVRDFIPGDRFLSGSNRDTLWEKAYMLVGMENMMTYLLTEPEYAREILHRIMDFQLGIAAHYLSLGIEVAYLSDDLGTQNSLILSPSLIDGFLVPEYERLFALYKSRGVLIHFHSCGHIEPALDTLMVLGVDILNPIQVSANDLDAVRLRTQGRMALSGGIGTTLLMDGPPERIRGEVHDTILRLGRNGGYFCAPDQHLRFPTAHFEAYERALEDFGRYPLKA